MGIRYVLRYGNEFEGMRQWDLFLKIFAAANGRRNLLVFRVMTALISELGVEDCDEYTMINEIERWTCERLSTRKSPYTQNKEESAPAGTNIRAPAIKDDPEAADSLLPKEEARNVPPQSVSFDTSMFSGMNRAISLSDI